MSRRSFDWRSFISFTLAWTGTGLFLSGIVLYIAPRGRYANWSGWKFLFLTKDQWTDLHVAFALLFVVAGVFHLFKFNWKVFTGFLKKRGLALVLSLAVALLFFAGSYNLWFPFNYLPQLSDYMKDYWERGARLAPVPHLEEKSLKEVAEEHLGLSPKEAVQRLRQQGIEVSDPRQSLKEIAEKAGVSPNRIYELLKEAGEQKPSSAGPGPGRGFGRMTLRELASSMGKEPSRLVEELEKKGLKVPSQDATLREIGDLNGMHPRQIYDLLVQEE